MKIILWLFITSMPYICVIRQSIRKEMSKSRALAFAVLLGSDPAGWRFASLKRTSFVAKARSLPVPVAAFSMSSKLCPDSKWDKTFNNVS